MAEQERLGVDRLMALAQASAAVTQACACAIETYRGWTRVPPDFPQAQMRTVGSLRGDPYADPTYTEYRPAGTDYWSADAPIAPAYFPYNRCTVQRCRACGRHCLAYVEAGGYYTEPRIRALDPGLIVDAPLPD
jgi:hypothetical protein